MIFIPLAQPKKKHKKTRLCLPKRRGMAIGGEEATRSSCYRFQNHNTAFHSDNVLKGFSASSDPDMSPRRTGQVKGWVADICPLCQHIYTHTHLLWLWFWSQANLYQASLCPSCNMRAHLVIIKRLTCSRAPPVWEVSSPHTRIVLYLSL